MKLACGVRAALLRGCVLAITLWVSASAEAASYRFTSLYAVTAPDAGGIGWNGLTVSSVAIDGSAIGGGNLRTNLPPQAVYWAPDGTPHLMGDVTVWSRLAGAAPGQQVGSYWSGTVATVWAGGVDSLQTINPSQLGFRDSWAIGTSGAQQVGAGDFAYESDVTHALLWSGTAASAVDLHPTVLANFSASQANATDGVEQVGTGTFGSSIYARSHAMLWTGTAASAIDLHPTKLSGFDHSEALGVGGGQQVGDAQLPTAYAYEFVSHPVVWSGSADSAVDLSSALAPVGQALATNGSVQVGTFTNGDGHGHAAAWSGTADSVVDLNQFIPFAFDSARATSVDDAGNVYGYVQLADGSQQVVEWAVPEPGLAGVLGAIGLAIGRGRRSRSRGQLPR